MGAVTDSWEYNGFGEPVRYTARYGNTPLLDIVYTRDKLGRITEKTETIDGATTSYAYGYDLADRLEEVRIDGTVSETYGYDENDNRVRLNESDIATYDAQDRLLTYGAASYSYTANGELESKVEGGETTTYSYDALGNLKEVKFPDGTLLEYEVDGLDRRMGEKVNGMLVQRFLYRDQLNPVAELDGGGNVVARFIYGHKDYVPSYILKSGASLRIVSDHLGSPRLVVNATTGEIVQRIDYDAFGIVLRNSNPGVQPFAFSGGL